MVIVIGGDRIGSCEAVGVVFQHQIGVTRIGRGGRAKPRCRSGRMASVDGLVASTIEEIDTEPRPNPRPVAAPHARAVLVLSLLVVTSVARASSWLARTALGLARIAWAAIVGRPGRIFRAAQPWADIYRRGMAPVW